MSEQRRCTVNHNPKTPKPPAKVIGQEQPVYRPFCAACNEPLGVAELERDGCTRCEERQARKQAEAERDEARGERDDVEDVIRDAFKVLLPDWDGDELLSELPDVLRKRCAACESCAHGDPSDCPSDLLQNVADWFRLSFPDYVIKWGEEPPDQETMANRLHAATVDATHRAQQAEAREAGVREALDELEALPDQKPYLFRDPAAFKTLVSEAKANRKARSTPSASGVMEELERLRLERDNYREQLLQAVEERETLRARASEGTPVYPDELREMARLIDPTEREDSE